MTRRHRGSTSTWRRAAALATIATMTGCGDGTGNGSGGAVAVVTGTPTPSPSSSAVAAPPAEPLEYQRSNAAVAANADAAYRLGATGRGVRIAIIDTGITPGLGEFAGRIDPASGDVGAIAV